MKHFIESSKNNIVLVTTRQLTSIQFNHSFVTDKVSDMCFISNKGRESNYFFPLYLFKQKEDKKRKSEGAVMMIFEPEAEYETKKPNFFPEFRKALSTRYIREPTPEEIFYYIYAILYSPTYRKRYKEFLKIDFPRIPLPSDYEVFKGLSNLGKELVNLHLLKASALDETEIGFPKGGSNRVEKISYDEGNQGVFINKEQFFEGISKEVWEYRIGAYQVMEKYLKDRKKRKLSLDEINHYMKVAKAIRLTIKLQEKIEDVYRKIKV